MVDHAKERPQPIVARVRSGRHSVLGLINNHAIKWETIDINSDCVYNQKRRVSRNIYQSNMCACDII